MLTPMSNSKNRLHLGVGKADKTRQFGEDRCPSVPNDRALEHLGANCVEGFLVPPFKRNFTFVNLGHLSAEALKS